MERTPVLRLPTSPMLSCDLQVRWKLNGGENVESEEMEDEEVERKEREKRRENLRNLTSKGFSWVGYEQRGFGK